MHFILSLGMVAPFLVVWKSNPGHFVFRGIESNWTTEQDFGCQALTTVQTIPITTSYWINYGDYYWCHSTFASSLFDGVGIPILQRLANFGHSLFTSGTPCLGRKLSIQKENYRRSTIRLVLQIHWYNFVSKIHLGALLGFALSLGTRSIAATGRGSIASSRYLDVCHTHGRVHASSSKFRYFITIGGSDGSCCEHGTDIDRVVCVGSITRDSTHVRMSIHQRDFQFLVGWTPFIATSNRIWGLLKFVTIILLCFNGVHALFQPFGKSCFVPFKRKQMIVTNFTFLPIDALHFTTHFGGFDDLLKMKSPHFASSFQIIRKKSA